MSGSGGKKGGKLLAPQFKFQPRGKSGLMISELFPQLGQHADDICLLNGMHTTNAAHPQAAIALHTGSVNFVRPSLGSWVVYGLGSTNQNLPWFCHDQSSQQRWWSPKLRICFFTRFVSGNPGRFG